MDEAMIKTTPASAAPRLGGSVRIDIPIHSGMETASKKWRKKREKPKGAGKRLRKRAGTHFSIFYNTKNTVVVYKRNEKV